MVRKYYPIDEETARESFSMMSFRDYKQNSATAEYKALVDEVYSLADKLAEVRPDQAERGYMLADRYARKMADNINKYNRIGTRCPSVMISGAGNFPVNKKRKQVEAWDNCERERQEIGKIKDKICSIINGKDLILIGEPDAVQRLEQKVETLRDTQERMKAVNKFYRQHGNLEGCPELSEEQIKEITEDMKNCEWKKAPFSSYTLSNNRQKLKSAEERLEQIKNAKDEGDVEQADENGLYTLIENTEIMRVQFEFDGKPADEIRDILKSNGFRWSPKAGRWQRQLTTNGKWAAHRVVEEIKKLQEAGTL